MTGQPKDGHNRPMKQQEVKHIVYLIYDKGDTSAQWREGCVSINVTDLELNRHMGKITLSYSLHYTQIHFQIELETDS